MGRSPMPTRLPSLYPQQAVPISCSLTRKSSFWRACPANWLTWSPWMQAMLWIKKGLTKLSKHKLSPLQYLRKKSSTLHSVLLSTRLLCKSKSHPLLSCPIAFQQNFPRRNTLQFLSPKRIPELTTLFMKPDSALQPFLSLP